MAQTVVPSTIILKKDNWSKPDMSITPIAEITLGTGFNSTDNAPFGS